MTSVSTLIMVELRKLIRRPMTWILILILLGIILFVYGSLIATILGPDVGDLDKDALREVLVLPDGTFFGATIVQQVGTVVLIVLAAATIGSEFSWATFRSMLFMGASRLRLLIAKLIALLLVALALVGTGLVFAVGAALASEAIVGLPPDAATWSSGSLASDIALATGITFVTVAIWTLVSATITLVTRSLATGLGVTLALGLLGGQVAYLIGQLGTAGRWISRVFPNRAIDALNAVASSEPETYTVADWAWISANLAGWTVLLVMLSLLAFRRMNLLSG